MTSKKSAGKTYTVVQANAYWVDDEPVKAGTKIQLTKSEAVKLLHRGIVEET